jgi:uncharacterized protein YbjT (DUF2867 family)
MRIVIIGGSGHVGTYLVPRLVGAKHEVTNVSRARREPYKTHSAWRLAQQVIATGQLRTPPACSVSASSS